MPCNRLFWAIYFQNLECSVFCEKLHIDLFEWIWNSVTKILKFRLKILYYIFTIIYIKYIIFWAKNLIKNPPFLKKFARNLIRRCWFLIQYRKLEIWSRNCIFWAYLVQHLKVFVFCENLQIVVFKGIWNPITKIWTLDLKLLFFVGMWLIFSLSDSKFKKWSIFIKICR